LDEWLKKIKSLSVKDNQIAELRIEKDEMEVKYNKLRTDISNILVPEATIKNISTDDEAIQQAREVISKLTSERRDKNTYIKGLNNEQSLRIRLEKELQKEKSWLDEWAKHKFFDPRIGFLAEYSKKVWGELEGNEVVFIEFAHNFRQRDKKWFTLEGNKNIERVDFILYIKSIREYFCNR